VRTAEKLYKVKGHIGVWTP